MVALALLLRGALPMPHGLPRAVSGDLAGLLDQHALCGAAPIATGMPGPALPDDPARQADHDRDSCCLYHASAAAALTPSGVFAPVAFAALRADPVSAAVLPIRVHQPGSLRARAPPLSA